MAKKVAGAGAAITDEGPDAEPEVAPNLDPQLLTTDPSAPAPAVAAQPDAPQPDPVVQPEVDPSLAPPSVIADEPEEEPESAEHRDDHLDAARTVEAMARASEQAGDFATSHTLNGVAGALAVLKGKLMACDYHFEGDLGLMIRALRDEL